MQSLRAGSLRHIGKECSSILTCPGLEVLLVPHYEPSIQEQEDCLHLHTAGFFRFACASRCCCWAEVFLITRNTIQHCLIKKLPLLLCHGLNWFIDADCAQLDCSSSKSQIFMQEYFFRERPSLGCNWKQRKKTTNIIKIPSCNFIWPFFFFNQPSTINRGTHGNVLALIILAEKTTSLSLPLSFFTSFLTVSVYPYCLQLSVSGTEKLIPAGTRDVYLEMPVATPVSSKALLSTNLKIG